MAGLRYGCLAVVSGALLCAASPPIGWWPLAWVALVPWIVALACGGGVWIWVGIVVAGLIAHLVPLDWIRTCKAGIQVVGGEFGAWLLIGALGAADWTAASVIARSAIRGPVPLILSVPTVWTAFEFLRAQIGTALAGSAFPFLQLSATQTSFPLVLQPADLGGAWAVSWLVAAGNGAAAEIVLRWPSAAECADARARLRRTSVALLLIGTFVACYGARRVAESFPLGPVVCLMPACQDDDGRRRQVDAARRPDADILLWQEGELATGREDRPAGDVAGDLARQAAACCVLGCQRTEPGERVWNSIAVAAPRLGFLGYYDKASLVPWAEFAPASSHVLGSAKGSYRAGTAAPVFEFNSGHGAIWKGACAICYDVCFSTAFRRYFTTGAEWPEFFLVASSERSDPTLVLQELMLDQTILRAIETRRAIVRNVDYGWSGLIDPAGRFQRCDRVPLVWRPTRLAPLPRGSGCTFYARTGDWFPLACIAGTVALLIVNRRHSPR